MHVQVTKFDVGRVLGVHANAVPGLTPGVSWIKPTDGMTRSMVADLDDVVVALTSRGDTSPEAIASLRALGSREPSSLVDGRVAVAQLDNDHDFGAVDDVDVSNIDLDTAPLRVPVGASEHALDDDLQIQAFLARFHGGDAAEPGTRALRSVADTAPIRTRGHVNRQHADTLGFERITATPRTVRTANPAPSTTAPAPHTPAEPVADTQPIAIVRQPRTPAPAEQIDPQHTGSRYHYLAPAPREQAPRQPLPAGGNEHVIRSTLLGTSAIGGTLLLAGSAPR